MGIQEEEKQGLQKRGTKILNYLFGDDSEIVDPNDLPRMNQVKVLSELSESRINDSMMRERLDSQRGEYEDSKFKPN